MRNTILTSKVDSSPCLLDCSNHGVCNLTSLKCDCYSGFEGKNCEIEKDPCSSYPCINEGRCLNLTNKNYTCNCSKLFFGPNCQWKIDVCENENCNEHGYCIDNSTVPSCICIKGLEGEKCEITSQYFSYIFFFDCTSSNRKKFGIKNKETNKRIEKKKNERIHLKYTP